jgi:hypothetical protein
VIRLGPPPHRADPAILQAAGQEYPLDGGAAERDAGFAPVPLHILALARQPLEPDHRGGGRVEFSPQPGHEPVEGRDAPSVRDDGILAHQFQHPGRGNLLADPAQPPTRASWRWSLLASVFLGGSTAPV